MLTNSLHTTNIRKHFNMDRMFQYLGQDQETIKEILSLVLLELDVSVKKFEDHISNANLVGIKDTAHKLIGTSSSVGLVALSEMARSVEDEPDFDPININIYYLKIKKEVGLVIQLIKTFLEKMVFS